MPAGRSEIHFALGTQFLDFFGYAVAQETHDLAQRTPLLEPLQSATIQK
jgi:hypothetical protein